MLASRSPQRRALLDALGVRFQVRPSGLEERESGDAETVARENALGKASAVACGPDELVLGVDTVVSLDGRLYGKPADEAHARDTLSALAGATHTVVSAVALVRPTVSPRIATCASEVTFRALPAPVLAWYLATGEWRERAGGYAIQGAGSALVASITGDWSNIVGLPVGTLLELHPDLLAPCNNRFSPPEAGELQP